MTIVWNEVTIWWNEVTKGWNEVVWNEVVMERSDRNSCVHIRTVEDLSGIVNSPVLFDVFKHELRPEGKEHLSYLRAEHEPENISILQRI